MVDIFVVIPLYFGHSVLRIRRLLPGTFQETGASGTYRSKEVYLMTKPTEPLSEQAKTRTRQITLTGLMTAVLCILGPLSIPLPVSPVPITLTNLAVFFAVYLLGMRRSTVCASALSGSPSSPPSAEDRARSQDQRGDTWWDSSSWRSSRAS